VHPGDQLVHERSSAASPIVVVKKTEKNDVKKLSLGKLE
jgi:hypothetical protein